MRMRLRDRRGVAAMEFGLIAPMFLLLFFGIAETGIVFYEYMTLINAVTAGANQLALSAGIDSTPYTDAKTVVTQAAPTLTPLTITMSVNGTNCATDSTCGTALSSAAAQYATVSAEYSCANINIVFDLFPSCTLTSQQTERLP